MSVIQFKTKLFQIGPWTIALLPADASAGLPSRGQVMVKGTINGAPLVTALEPDGNGSHWFRVEKRLQKTIGAEAGDTVSLAVEATKDWPEPAVPADVQKALVDNPRIHPLWTRVTPMARWEWLRWINSTSKEETRKNRIAVAASKLLHGERRPCCFNRNMCCVPEVSKNGVLRAPAAK